MSVKPNWLRAKAPTGKVFNKTLEIINLYNLHTVCIEAACPNIGECWNNGHVTIMILGSICTRSCKFCNVKTGIPNKLDLDEPKKLAKIVKKLDLKHVVITSVDRDDLPDGGASQFIKCIKEVRKAVTKKIIIEILTPDFLNKKGAFESIANASPDIYNHNIETVPRLYVKIKPKARYFHSLYLLKMVKKINPKLFTKSGLMVGLGETKEEILQVMDDLRSAEVDFITIGQYLQPTINHIKIDRYVLLEEFEYYKYIAYSKGFLLVESSPLTRSSYQAKESFEKLKNYRY